MTKLGVRLALIGANNQGKEHLIASTVSVNATITCVAERDDVLRLKLERDFSDVGFYSDWSKMLDEEPVDENLGVDYNHLRLAFFDRWLKGLSPDAGEMPAVRIFVMGGGSGRRNAQGRLEHGGAWRAEKEWPLARARPVDYYLHSGGKANSLRGDGILSSEPPAGESPDVFLYNPRDPVPTRGGGLCCNPYFLAGGSYDNRELETRPDVLVYSTSPLTKEMEVTGPIMVTLWAVSSTPDTDYTAKLLDVCTCGEARNLTDGIIRARYRDSVANPSLIKPGDIYKYTIDLWATSNVFKPGHSIRLEVSSSNFPRFDRNPNTGLKPGEDAELLPATQTILHDLDHPSYITLPLIPR